MPQIEMKINHLNQLKRTAAEINRRVEILEKEIRHDIHLSMLKAKAENK